MAGSRRCSSTATTLGTGTPAVSVAQVEVVLAWTGIHSGPRGSCTATVANTDMGTDTGISSCMRVALVWVWAPLLAACTAKQAAGMGTGTDTGISPCT